MIQLICRMALRIGLGLAPLVSILPMLEPVAVGFGVRAMLACAIAYLFLAHLCPFLYTIIAIQIIPIAKNIVDAIVPARTISG